MTLTYLTLVNDTLKRLNEVQLTSSNFSSTTAGFQAAVKDYVNIALQDIYNAESEWPFNFVSGTQTLTPGVSTYDLPTGYVNVDNDSFYITTPELITNGNFTSAITGWTNISTGTGSAAYTSTGNGRARLAAGASGTAAMTQAITTVTGRPYRVQTRIFGGTINILIGTTSGGGEIVASTAMTYTASDGGQFYEHTFTATGSSAYITYSHTTNANHDVDFVSCFENVNPKHLEYMNFDYWRQNVKPSELRMSATAYDMPTDVYITQNSKFGVSTIPDKAYTVTYDYWTLPSDLSAYTDTATLPDRYKSVAINGAMKYAYMFRDNVEQAETVEKDFNAGIELMRRDLIDRAQVMSS